MSNLLPNTDGQILLYQGRDCAFTVSVKDADGVPIQDTDRILAMQIRESIASDVVLIDVADYASSSSSEMTAEVLIPAGATSGLDITTDFVEWIADAKFVKTGSDPQLAQHAGRFTVKVYRQATR